MKIIALTLIALAIGAVQARAAVTVYAEEMPSNDAVAGSASAVETNGTTAKSRRGDAAVRIDETGVHIGGTNPVDINTPVHLQSYMLVSLLAVASPFVTGVAVIAIVFYSKHRRNRMVHETLRAMIEKGTPITPELVANLRGGGCGNSTGEGFARKQSGRLLPGLIMIAIGAALLIADPKHSRMGGIALLFMGLAFLVVWMVERKNQDNQLPPR
jgi:hypothetical protein